MKKPYILSVGQACPEDSGGPLVAQVNGVPTLVGLYSWGPSCSSSVGHSKGYPGIYTDISKYADWIFARIEQQISVHYE